MSSCGRDEERAPVRAGSGAKFHAITVEARPRYSVYVGPDLYENLHTFCDHYPRTFVLTDENVARHQLARLGEFPRSSTFVVPPGESSKSFTTLEKVLDAMVAANLDRRSGLIAFGGGVIGDLGGLAAALFMRGIDCVQVPTTLLAMVDSSVGGKTAVNLPAGKNLAGAFHDPREVYADTTTLATLSDDEYRSGLGEVLKTAVLDGPLFEKIEKSAARLVKRDPKFLADVVRGCVIRKAAIVAQDPYEKGPRKLLNLGHTFAHAIEHAAGFGTIPHGIAVATGVVLAARIGVELERSPHAIEDRVVALARTLGLPVTLAELRTTYAVALADDALLAAMKHDKKARSGDPRFVVPYDIGLAAFDAPVPEPTVRTVLQGSR